MLLTVVIISYKKNFFVMEYSTVIIFAVFELE